MEFRWITGQEMIETIQPIILRNGWTPLNPNTAIALVASEENVLCGFYVLQLFPHVEPIYVEKDLRGSGLAEELADRMREYLTQSGTRGYMVIADSPFAAKMCEARGMVKVQSPVYMVSERVH